MSVHDNIFHTYKDHNPFWRAKAPNYLQRRHDLFYTSIRRPPGLYSKASWVLIVFTTLYGLHVLKRTRKRKERWYMVNNEFTRKALPFLQAIEDRRFLAMEQRKNWMLDALFKDNREEYLALSRLFNDPTVWPEPFDRTSIYMCGIPKTYKGPLRGNLNYILGNDSYVKGNPSAHY
ncbi:hypothetical protein SteCoe_7944 [Stentor coeruleus]|uniref:Uncharacterized protein n=1 Tax=Stentor coeruleus TaxID=5963 RepID=A0A1R2CLG8_9CILI|nr:hypothetical protein SteCoe_7944 [Stentor coeruleus]